MDKVCRNFMDHKCKKDNCRFIHDKSLCYHFWKYNSCKWGDQCRKNHFVTTRKKTNLRRLLRCKRERNIYSSKRTN